VERADTTGHRKLLAVNEAHITSPGGAGLVQHPSIVGMAGLGVALTWILGAEIRHGALAQAARSAQVVADTAVTGALRRG